MNLFIIGNGFDSAHKMKTAYWHFIKFLEKKYKDLYHENISEVYIAPDAVTMPDGSEVYMEQDVLEFIYSLLHETDCGENWSELEAALGYLEYSAYLENQVDDFKSAYNNEDAAASIKDVTEKVLDYLQEWAMQIEIGKPAIRKRFLKKIQPDDLFLNFNYTKTLEELYGVPAKSVCHIHGVQGKGQLMFGHGQDDDRKLPLGAEKLEFLQRILRKDVNGALAAHNDFFCELENRKVEKIYSYGFDFGNVDLPYIREIMKRLGNTENIYWYQNSFPLKKNPNALINQQKKIRDCGYCGEFGKPFS